MWSEPNSSAMRVSAAARIASFWDEAPVTAIEHEYRSVFVSHGDGQQQRPPQSASVPAPPPAPEQVEARPSFAELERDAFMKGYAQGERAGAEAAAKRGDATLRRLAQTVEELAGLRTELVQKTERQVVELALAIAGRVLRREVSLDRELLVTMARIALERLGENTSATIRLNPDDYAFIGAKLQVGDSSLVRVVADPLVNSGGCLVQSDFGLINVVVNRQMARAGASVARNAYLLDPSTIKLGVYRDIAMEQPAKTGDAEKRVLLCEYTLIVKNEAANGVISDLYGMSASA